MATNFDDFEGRVIDVITDKGNVSVYIGIPFDAEYDAQSEWWDLCVNYIDEVMVGLQVIFGDEVMVVSADGMALDVVLQ